MNFTVIYNNLSAEMLQKHIKAQHACHALMLYKSYAFKYQSLQGAS